MEEDLPPEYHQEMLVRFFTAAEHRENFGMCL